MIQSFSAGLALTVGLVWLEPALAQRPLADSFASRPGTACEAVGSLTLPELRSIAADWIEAGTAPDTSDGADAPLELPAYCRVRGTIEPSIRVEIWLPSPDVWNGRFLGLGGTDFGGNVAYGPMQAALARAYATASTDTGHGRGPAWLGNEGLVRDFGYRAVFEMTSKAQAAMAAFYGRPADFRYFSGCGLGGRQGLMEAERFPEDYDGIVAGSPLTAVVAERTSELLGARAARPAGGQASLLGPDALALVNAAVIEQCDTLDGVRDGVLEDPRRCNFDPARLACGIGATNRCLTDAQITAFRQIYAGPIDPETGFGVLPGLAQGSETGWQFAADGSPSADTLAFFEGAVFKDDPFWNWRNFAFPVDYARAEDEVGWMLDATRTDLSGLKRRGGRLIVYQGWNDVTASPLATIAWYEKLEAAFSSSADGSGVESFARLFMVPGLKQCAGSPGALDFDAQRAIENWVERGIAPQRIEAALLEDDQVVRTRPLCPYPQTARYRNGNSERSGSYVCQD